MTAYILCNSYSKFFVPTVAILNSVGIYKFSEFSLSLYFGISATINLKIQSSYSIIMFNIFANPLL